MSLRKADVIIVGLGNPGPEYLFTRHNIGFLFVDFVAKRWGVEFRSSAYDSLYTTKEVAGRFVYLVKPLTYMNRSGVSVSKWLKNLPSVNCDNLLVVYDDIDIPRGSIRIRCGGSSGGHKGLVSLIEETGTSNFARLRIGVGRPPGYERDREEIVRWLLTPMSNDEVEEYFRLIESLVPVVEVYAEFGFQKAASYLSKLLSG